MTVSRKGITAICLALLLPASLALGLAQSSQADGATLTSKVQTSFHPVGPVIKIDRAMVQERETLPDGTIRMETYLAPALEQSAQATRKRSVAAKAVSKIKA